jgi:hypothetical protein
MEAAVEVIHVAEEEEREGLRRLMRAKGASA